MGEVLQCWEVRGCDPEMMGRCPHASDKVYAPCPADCRYADCRRDRHVVATDYALLLDATVDRKSAIKEACMFCEHFLRNAPRLRG